MTQERFFRMLSNPELLSTVSYEELKTLVLAYPYAHNLRYLLAIKSNQIAHPDHAKNLAAAAAASLDRHRLFQILAPKRLAPQKIEEVPAVLELRPIEEVRGVLEAKVPMPASTERTENVAFATSPPASAIPHNNPSTEVLFDFSEVLRRRNTTATNKIAEIPEESPIEHRASEKHNTKEMLVETVAVKPTLAENDDQLIFASAENAPTFLEKSVLDAQNLPTEIPLEFHEGDVASNENDDQLIFASVANTTISSEKSVLDVQNLPTEIPFEIYLGDGATAENDDQLIFASVENASISSERSVTEAQNLPTEIPPKNKVKSTDEVDELAERTDNQSLVSGEENDEINILPFHKTPILIFAQPPKLAASTFRPTFHQWQSQFNLPSLVESKSNPEKEESSSVATVKSPGDKSAARILAEKSVTENKDLVSETLARLYVRQGYHEKAIAMYRKLSLAIPEKSHFFAAEIEKLKK